MGQYNNIFLRILGINQVDGFRYYMTQKCEALIQRSGGVDIPGPP